MGEQTDWTVPITIPPRAQHDPIYDGSSHQARFESPGPGSEFALCYGIRYLLVREPSLGKSRDIAIRKIKRRLAATNGGGLVVSSSMQSG